MEEYWIKNPKILIENYKEINFFSETHITEKKINNITRFLIYISFYCIIFTNYKLLYTSVIINILINIIGYIYYEEKQINLKKDKIKEYNNCRQSTINNPFMNRDILDTRQNTTFCNTNDNFIINNLKDNLYQDETDINALKKLRIFVTVPERNYKKFIDFLNLDKSGCKNKGIGCNLFRDLRYNN